MTERLRVTVNGTERELTIEGRRLLSDVIREDLGLTGTKRGCETGKCGACTVLLNGDPVKSCCFLALQAHGDEVRTIEDLRENGDLTDLQRSFWDNLSFQCGFCTPGLLMNAQALLEENPDPSDEEIRDHISGNICRCTGYVNIVEGIRDAASNESDGDGS